MHQSGVSAFLNQKGGVGKTTSVVNVGAGLVMLGERVLIIDLDPQGHLTSFLGIPRDQIRSTIYDVLCGEVPPQDAIIRKEMRARAYTNGREVQLSMAVIPATLDLAEAEMVLVNRGKRESLLKNAIASLRDDFDHILIDCSPSLGLLSTNALVASQTVFVPVQTEFLALESLNDLLGKIESVTTKWNPGLEVGGLIATRFDNRKVLSRMVVETMRERFGALLLDTIIRDNIALAESPSVGKDIFSYRARSFGAEDYLNLSREILDRVTGGDSFFAAESGVLAGEKSDSIAM